MIKIKHILYLSFIVSVFMLLGSCKKEYVKTAYNNVEEFTIADSAGNKLKASIVGDSIRLYWPPFQTVPTNVAPQISVSSGASISPASGISVAFKKGISYTVTAQDGSKKTYFLVPMINQPAPVFSINESSINQAGYLFLKGQYFIPDTSQTKLFLVNTAGKQISLSLKNALSFNSLAITIKLPNNLSIDTGNYKLKLINGSNTVVKGPFHIGPADFSSFLLSASFNQAGKTLKIGDEISISYVISELGKKYYPGTFGNLQLMVRPVNGSSEGYDDVYYDIPLSGQDGQTLLKYKLPADVVPGSIILMMPNYEIASSGEIGYPYYWDGTTEPLTAITK
ncbi:hypothetical protein [Mucilaginibacter sp.]|uniref:hypothetical protein n=1 Tax=Mucilaginibacter sp. TaxID=1882438 RepID=UPI002ED140C6